MKTKLSVVPVFLLIMALAGASKALAWGPEGHEIISKIALYYLSPVARDNLDDVLGKYELSDYDITCWPDEIRGSKEYKERYPNNGNWHYVDFDVKQRYDDDFELIVSDSGNDIVSQIQRWRDELAGGTLKGEERLNALRFLIHFVGDVHQPLHCAFRYGDMGGNMIPVRSFEGKKYSFGPDDEMDYSPNLHATWDAYLVHEMVGRKWTKTVARELYRGITPEQAQRWREDDVMSWAVDSYWRARKQAYRWSDGKPLPAKWSLPGMDLTSENYIDSQLPVVREQLQKGGVRLAHVLNTIYDPDYELADINDPEQTKQNKEKNP
jgi:hypothetical protein